jgi:hypothetical protein
MATSRKNQETKLTAYNYENEFIFERTFAPSNRNPGEPKRRFMSAHNAARNSQPRAPGGFALRLHSRLQ